MSHAELSEIYELYALGVLTGEEKVELESHLANNCPDCVAGVRHASAFNTLFTLLPEPREPAKRLRRRVIASVGGPEPASRNWLAVLALASACFLIAAGVATLQERRRSEELTEARQQSQQTAAELRDAREQLRRSTADVAKIHAAMQFLNQPETEQVVFGKGQPLPPRGRVFVNAQQGVLLLASNLPPAPAGKIYEMWLIPASGPPKPAGLFQSDPGSTAIYVLSGAFDRAHTKAVAVTLEPAAGSSAPTSKPIIAAPLPG